MSAFFKILWKPYEYQYLWLFHLLYWCYVNIMYTDRIYCLCVNMSIRPCLYISLGIKLDNNGTEKEKPWLHNKQKACLRTLSPGKSWWNCIKFRDGINKSVHFWFFMISIWHMMLWTPFFIFFPREKVKDRLDVWGIACLKDTVRGWHVIILMHPGEFSSGYYRCILDCWLYYDVKITR